jgi:hypothetical protein
MRASSLPARTDRDCRYAERHGNIGVGRGAVQPGTDAEMCVHGAQGRDDPGIVRQPGRRAAADFTQFRRNLRTESAGVLNLFRPGGSAVQGCYQLFDFFVVLGPDIHFGACARGDRVHAGTALYDSEVHSNAGG